MDKQNVVAIWLMKLKDEDELKEMLEESYSKDRKRKIKLLDYIKIHSIDSDFIEATFYYKDDSFIDIFDEISYIEYFNEDFMAILKSNATEKYNSLVLIYGQKSIYGSYNEKLFNYNPKKLDRIIRYLGKIEFTN